MKFGFLDIVLILLTFQLILFSFFLFIRKAKFISNYLLGIQLFSQAAGIFGGFCTNQYFYFIDSFPGIFFSGDSFVFLWGPTFYFYVKSIAYKDFKLKIIHILHFIPFIIALSYLLITFFPISAEEKRFLINSRTYPYIVYGKFITMFVRVQVLFYIIKSIYVLNSVRIRLEESHSSISITHYSWLKFLIIGFTACYFLSLPLSIIFHYISYPYNPMIYLGMVGPYFIYYNILFFKAWYASDVFIGVDEHVKYKSSKLKKEEADILLEKLEKYIISEKPFLNPDITLSLLADNLNMLPRTLSQLINEYYNQNFYDYINSLRVEESKKLLLDSSCKRTVLEILYEVGFNNKSAYNIAFKKFTGLTPTEYKKQHYIYR